MDLERPQVSIKRELSPRERAIADSIESFPALHTRDKIFLILVWRKLKSATPVSIPANFQHRATPKFEEIVKRAGLYFEPSSITAESRRGLVPGKVCFISNNERDLDIMSKLWFRDQARDRKVYREIGRMSGFPPTAIDAYDEVAKLPDSERQSAMDKFILTHEEIKKLIPPELQPFSYFFFISREHWQEELEVIRKWTEEIKLVAPRLYEEHLENFKKYHEN